MAKRDAVLAHDYADGDLAPIKPAIAAISLAPNIIFNCQ
jgi:hypothetical protein